MDALDFNITYYQKLEDKGQILPAREMVDMILNSTQEIADKQANFKKTKNKTRYLKSFKKSLPLVVWHTSTITGDREDFNVNLTNGRMMLDLDKIKDKNIFNSMIEYFKKDPYVILSFISPSGIGLKVLYYTDVTDVSVYLSAYSLLCDKIVDGTEFGKYIDRTSSNLSRGQFICSDPNIYINSNAKQMKIQDESKSKI
jgi:hypothetical protein